MSLAEAVFDLRAQEPSGHLGLCHEAINFYNNELKS